MEFHTDGKFCGGPYDGMLISFDTSNGWTEPPGTISVDQGAVRMELHGTLLKFLKYGYSDQMRYVSSEWYVEIEGEFFEFFSLAHQQEDMLELAKKADGRVLIEGKYTWEAVE